MSLLTSDGLLADRAETSNDCIMHDPNGETSVDNQQAERTSPADYSDLTSTAEVSDKETTFLDTKVYKGERFAKESRLDITTHFKATETFQYTHFSSCHPPGVKKGFIKGEALRLLRTNSSKSAFNIAIKQFKTNLIAQRLFLRRENTPYYRNRNQIRESCLLSHNIAHQCLT